MINAALPNGIIEAVIRIMLNVLARRYPVQKPMHIKNLDMVK
jgi:hypothetical protein